MEGDKEIGAMSKISAALVELDSAAVARVLRWATERYQVNVEEKQTEQGGTANALKRKNPQQHRLDDGEPVFDSFGELYAVAEPSTNALRVLVASYWAQVVNNQSELDSQSVNKVLKDLGHGIDHMPHALDELMAAKPRLALQLKKQGSAQQARRKFKLTGEGINVVRGMLAKAG